MKFNSGKGKLISRSHRIAVLVSDIGVYIPPIVQGVNYHREFNLFFEPNNPREKERIEELSEVAFSALSNRGAFLPRPHYP